MALRQIPLTMQDWETRLNRFIEATDREVLQDAGKVTTEIAKAHTESEFENTESCRINCSRAILTASSNRLLTSKNPAARRNSA
jgi:hypothetical protein